MTKLRSVFTAVWKRRTRYLIGALLALGATAPALAQMNVLVVMTDDQRFDTINKMPNIADLASQGVRFTNSYAPTPLCGPSRASVYSGGFLAQNTNVLGNEGPNGGAKVFNDRVNLGTVMQSAGYRTYFVGKWVNGYEGLGRYVPPGWDQWVGRHSFATTTDWYSFKYTLGSSDRLPSEGEIVTAQQYTTYYERDKILRFLDNQQGTQPFFIFWSPSAPHEQATPALEDANAYTQFTYRGRGYGETDMSDKPRWVRNNNNPDGDDDTVRHQLQTLQSVDRSFADVVDKLRALGKFDNTLIVFASDNGYLWGEHGLWGKNKSYEESAEVPFIVWMPGVAPRVDGHLVSPMLDLGATIYDLAGVTRRTDGDSLVPLLQNPNTAWRRDFFFENSTTSADGNAIWAGLRNERWKYVRYWTGEEELYDLVNDPYELNSRHDDPGLATVKASLSARVDQQLGLAIVPVRSFPDGNVGVPYSFKFDRWGGVGPFVWTVDSGELPPGVVLDPASGALVGVPTIPGTYQFSVRIKDSVLAAQAGAARTFETRQMRLTVNP